MPCLVWRKGPVPRKDSRTTTDGNPIRNTHDLSFLLKAKTEHDHQTVTDYLYECQTSICLTGSNIHKWTAVALVDTFFEEEDGNNPNTVPHYVKEADPEAAEVSRDMDPLSIGMTTADDLWVKDPREYFPLVIRHRAERIKDEWENASVQLSQRINDHVRDIPDSSGEHRSVPSEEIA